MQLEITPEVLLKQLKLNVTPQNLLQMDEILKSTKGSELFFKHLFSLNDTLAHVNAFVAPSSTSNRLKIKYHGADDDFILSKFHKEVNHWGEKYKVDLERAQGKEAYYINGLAS